MNTPTRFPRWLSLALVVLFCLPLVPVSAAPNGFNDEVVAGLNDLNDPTAFAFLPSGDMLIALQDGQLVRYAAGQLIETPVLNLSPVICSDFERGLLGVAVDPEYVANKYIYLYYTFKRPTAEPCDRNDPANDPVNRVSRFTINDNWQAVDELILVDNIPSPNGNHNAGDIQFGNDGLLYIAIGDGGREYGAPSGGGNNDAARDTHTFLGKILRITRSGTIPEDNPFQGATTSERCYDPAAGGNKTGQTTPGKHCRETFAWGLRNPFRMAFDSNSDVTRFYINDVGQGRSEEINLGIAGADYGWNCYEGTLLNNDNGPCDPLPQNTTEPVFEYRRDQVPPGQLAEFVGCASITAGAFVPNGVWPTAFDGAYLFADYVCGKVFSLSSTGAPGFFGTTGPIVYMRFGPDGNSQALYYADYNGAIRRVRYVAAANRSPEASFAVNNSFGNAPLTVQFNASASSDPDSNAIEAYLWDFGDGNSTTVYSPLVNHTYQQSGVYTATLRVQDSEGALSSNISEQRIDVGNAPPVASIDAPAASFRFTVGQQITLRGSASDAQDGTLTGSQLRWEVRLRHDTHFHPYASGTGSTLQITAPAPEDLAAAENSYLEVIFEATDLLGRTSVVTREIQPQKVNLTFTSSPAGLQIGLTGLPGNRITAPRTVISWPGNPVEVSVPQNQSLNGVAMRFCGWSHTPEANHSLTTPAADQSYLAVFVPTSETCPANTQNERLYLPLIR
jgi:glucose/arabinose dehydrogenase/PKD repeat protein